MNDQITASDRDGTLIQRLGALPAYPELLAEGQNGYERYAEARLQNALPSLSDMQAVQLTKAFCCSSYIARILIAHPEWFEQDYTDQLLRQAFDTSRFQRYQEGLVHAQDDQDFMCRLRTLRQREMVRIAFRDLYGWSDLRETLSALSLLAEFCLQQSHARAYQEQCKRHGVPLSEEGVEQSLVVLAMGKLGGGELNYSSDIDLIFTYPDAGETHVSEPEQRSIDNQRFFLGQAQSIIRYLSEMTADGFVFRVDARLRPFGDSGALVVSFDFMESYYQNQGRDWERYAMIKARPVCGASEQQKQLEKLLKPFVYRRYLDYGAFTALRDMKALIMREVERKGLQENVKLGSGGIREIEFTGQAFQMIRGGRDPALRCRSIVTVLEKLAIRGVLDWEAVQTLQAAYQFLRDTENRLQMYADQQVHSLPPKGIDRQRLAYAMGYVDWESFAEALQSHRSVVSECFQGIFFANDASEMEQPNQCQLAIGQILDNKLSDEEAVESFRECGFDQVEQLFDQLRGFLASNALKHITPPARKRLSSLLPLLLSELSDLENAAETLGRVLNLLQAIVQRPVYLALLQEYPAALSQVVKLFSVSGWIADYLARQPILLDGLLDTEQLYYLPTREELDQQLKQLIDAQESEDVEQRLNALRHFKQEQVLRVAAVDVNQHLNVMKVSDQLTWLAEALLAQISVLSNDELVDKYGYPQCQNGENAFRPEIAVVAYGKLGGIELGYGSDLDFVLLHNSGGDNQQTDGERSVDNQTFFARLGQRIVYWLETPTLAGTLYEADLRLRPDGASGMLVSSMERFKQYQLERAWIWEHQALVRARMIVGSQRIQQEFERVRHVTLTQKRDHQHLRKEVRDMRERMRAEATKNRGDEFHLKLDRGGLADIEFLVQYGVLAWANQYPELTRYTDNVRILEQFRRLGLMSNEDVNYLTEAYLLLRAQIHHRALGGEKAVVDNADVAQEYVNHVAEIWCKIMEVDE